MQEYFVHPQGKDPLMSADAIVRSCPKYERSIFLAEKLKIIPLGGLDEIGKNCTSWSMARI